MISIFRFGLLLSFFVVAFLYIIVWVFSFSFFHCVKIVHMKERKNSPSKCQLFKSQMLNNKS